MGIRLENQGKVIVILRYGRKTGRKKTIPKKKRGEKTVEKLRYDHCGSGGFRYGRRIGMRAKGTEGSSY